MLYFHNGYPSKVWVAIMFYSPGTCGDYGKWGTRGWWGIDSGGRAAVYNGDTDYNRYYAYYAKAADGAEWTGPYGPVYVYHSAFDSCTGIGSTAAYGTVDMRLIDVQDFDDYTVNLIP
jgi:uncharacterized membrane protein